MLRLLVTTALLLGIAWLGLRSMRVPAPPELQGAAASASGPQASASAGAVQPVMRQLAESAEAEALRRREMEKQIEK